MILKPFKKILKSQLESQEASISFVGLLFFLVLSTLTIALIKQDLAILDKIRDRSRSYLCLKSEIKYVKKYINQITYTNYSLIALDAALAYPPSFEMAVEAIKIVKKIQYFFMISYMKNTMMNKYCAYKVQSFFAMNPIYSTKRNLFGLLKLRKKKYNLYIKGDLKWKIVLKTQLKLSSSLDATPEIKTSEMFQFLDLLQ